MGNFFLKCLNFFLGYLGLFPGSLFFCFQVYTNIVYANANFFYFFLLFFWQFGKLFYICTIQ